jgi:hypothetical protein
MDKDALKKLKKVFEKKSKEVLKDIDALAKHEKNGDMDNAELTRRRIRKSAPRRRGILHLRGEESQQPGEQTNALRRIRGSKLSAPSNSPRPLLGRSPVGLLSIWQWIDKHGVTESRPDARLLDDPDYSSRISREASTVRARCAGISVAINPRKAIPTITPSTTRGSRGSA